MSVLDIDDPDSGDFITERTYSGIRVTEDAEDDDATYSVLVDAYPETPCRKDCVRVGIHIYGGKAHEHTVMMDDPMPLEAVPESLYPSKLFCGYLRDYTGEDADPAGHINRVLGLMFGPFMKLQVTGVKDEGGTDKASTTVELAAFKGFYELI